jgi:hypothetical protein
MIQILNMQTMSAGGSNRTGSSSIVAGFIVSPFAPSVLANTTSVRSPMLHQILNRHRNVQGLLLPPVVEICLPNSICSN